MCLIGFERMLQPNCEWCTKESEYALLPLFFVPYGVKGNLQVRHSIRNGRLWHCTQTCSSGTLFLTHWVYTDTYEHHHVYIIQKFIAAHCHDPIQIQPLSTNLVDVAAYTPKPSKELAFVSTATCIQSKMHTFVFDCPLYRALRAQHGFPYITTQ